MYDAYHTYKQIVRNFKKNAMKNFFLYIISIIFFSCGNDYEKEEIKVISDITNEYLRRNHLNLDDEYLKLDTIQVEDSEFDVYISDVLIPIKQIKEDNEWMFSCNNLTKKDSILFNELINSEYFESLKYREFNKTEIKLDKPYNQMFEKDDKTTSAEIYLMFNFSRVCFNNEMNKGIVVIDYKIGGKYGFKQGYNMSLIILKVNGKWTYIKNV